MRQQFLLLSLVLLLSFPSVAAAQGAIEGAVLDNAGEPIPGAQVAIPEINVGSVTNAEGEYQISNVPAGEYTIEARFLGFNPNSKQVVVSEGETQTVNFELRQSAVDLDEIVVTGTGGPVEKRKLGNSIGSIDAANLVGSPVQSFSDILQGREPGVEGMPSSGTTGEGSRIRIRGSASLSQSNEPVVYVDGVRIDGGGGFSGAVGAGGGGTPSRLDDINPEAIERVEILKGAAAATLYGSEASNGVIQIFTKSGSPGPLSLTFQSRQGISTYPKVFEPSAGFARDIFNSNGELATSKEALAEQMSQHLDQSLQPYEIVERDFIHDLYETGRFQTYSLSASGGGESINYFLSGRWTSEDGPFGAKEGRGYPSGVETRSEDIQKVAQFQANISITPTDRLRLRATTGYTDRYNETFQNSNNIYGVLALTSFGQPRLVGPNNLVGTPVFATPNEVLQTTVEQNVEHFNGSIGINYRPIDALTLDATFGADVTNQQDEEMWPFGWNIDNFAAANTEGARYIGDRNNKEFTYDVKGTLESEFADTYSSSLVVGSQGFISKLRAKGASGMDFPGPGLDIVEAANERDATEFNQDVVSLGVFAQEQFGYADWLFFTVGGRLDANSAFGSDFDAAFYPKVQASLPLTDAPFWNDIGPVSSLRIRAALGQSGLQPGAFDALTTWEPLSSEFGPGIIPSNLGNPDLKPERATEWEVGLESSFYDNRYALEATYWDRTVSDALVQRQYPLTGGFQNLQLDNIGELKGRGLELSLDALILDREDLDVQLFASASYLWEQVTDLGGSAPIKVGGSYPRHRNFIKEGWSPGTFFGVKLLETESDRYPFDTNEDGQPDTKEELLSYFESIDPDTPSPSLLSDLNSFVLLADEDGDGDQLDHYLGKPTPDWQGSFGGSLAYSNFEIRSLFEYKAGNYYVSNLTGAFRRSGEAIGRNTPAVATLERDYITGGVDENRNPLDDPEIRFEAAQDWVNNYLALAPFSGMNTIERADFLRLRELSLTYSVPSSFLERLSGDTVQNLSLTLAGRNLALWTSYSGADPEASEVGRGGGSQLDNNFLLGTETYNLPLQRQISFTLRAGF